jgi:hypothetical protein
MPEIISRVAAKDQGLKRYFTGLPCKRGHVCERLVSNQSCCKCHYEHALVWKVQFARTPKGRAKAAARTAAHYAANRETIRDRQASPEGKVAARRYRATYYQTPHGGALMRALAARRRADKLKATPPWQSSEELDAIYEDRPDGFHVDHIHPLKGKLSCGLNVPWNLQYLPDTDNISKSNHMTQPGYFDWFSEPWTVHAPPTGRVWTQTDYDQI